MDTIATNPALSMVAYSVVVDSIEARRAGVPMPHSADAVFNARYVLSETFDIPEHEVFPLVVDTIDNRAAD